MAAYRERVTRNAWQLARHWCAEGWFTRKAAAKGWLAWGVDGKQEAISYAQQCSQRDGLSSAFFSAGLISPNMARHLPKFDVVLLLSAYHQVSKQHGEPCARAFFASVLGACRKKLIFEPASVNRKYASPIFDRDNDIETIQSFVKSILPSGWHVRCFGSIAYTPEEPFRHLFCIERDAI